MKDLLCLLLLLGFIAESSEVHAWGWPKKGTFEPWFTGGKPIDENAPTPQEWYQGVGKKWLFGASTLMDNQTVMKGTATELDILSRWDTMAPEEQAIQQTAYCYGLMHAARIGDAFECAQSLEAEMFRRYYGLENHESIGRATWSTNTYFGDVFTSIFEIYAQYYLAIGDAASAEHYASLTCELQSHSFYKELLLKQCLQIMAVAQVEQGNEVGARETLARIDEEFKDLRRAMRNNFEDIYKDARLTVLFALQDWPAAAEMLEGYDPGAVATKSAKRSVVVGVIAGVVGTILLVPQAASSLWDIAKAAPDIGDVLQNLQLEAVMLAHFRIAKVAFETGDAETARTMLDELIASPNIEMLPQTLQVSIKRDRARLYRDDGETRSAIDLYYGAIDTIESQRSNLRTEAGRIGFLGDRQSVYGELVALLVDSGDVVAAFDVVERAKARALVDLLASKTEFAGDAGAQVPAANFLEAASNASEWDLSDSVTGNTRKRGLAIEARQELVLEDPALASILVGSVPKTDAIRNRLGDNDVLIEFYGENDRWYEFVASREKISMRSFDGTGLRQAVDQLRLELQDPNAHEQPQAEMLYARLIAPIASEIHGREVTIVPHGVLHYVPFAALRDNQNWWGEQIAIRILPSAAVLDFLAARSEGSGSSTMLAMGDPDLGDPAYDLPGAKAEVQALAQMMPGMQTYFRGDATETRFRELAGQFNRIHIASHGVFDPDNPLASRLLLSPDATNDGNLTLPELYDLHLNADLVTLSACETGLGKISAGDDMVGLTRGWLFAGVRTIVSSLWQVDDAATALLMENFYGALNAGDTPRAAMQRAQSAVRKVYPQPYYWSGFQVVGAD